MTLYEVGQWALMSTVLVFGPLAGASLVGGWVVRVRKAGSSW